MSILVLCLFVLVIVVMLIYAVDLVPQFAPFNGLIKALIIIIAVVFIVSRSGLMA